MGKELRILILEDVPTDAELVERELSKAGIKFTSHRVETREDFLKELKEFTPDIILSDYKLPHFDGMAALEIAKELAPTIPFIIVTGSMNEETAVECMKAGASDYVIKDHLARLGPAVKGALENKQVREAKARLEEALWTSAREWRATFDAINYPVALTDLEVRIRRCNRAMANFLGKPFGEIIGRNCCSLIHSTSGPIEGCPVVRLRESQHRETLVLSIGDRWFNIVADPLPDENGSLIGAVHIMSDITEHKQAVEALKASEERFRLAAESSTDLIYEWDIKERVDWFGNIDELLGYASGEFPRTLEAWANSVYPDDRDRVTAAAKNQLEKNEPYNIDYRVSKKDGTYNYWWARGTAVRDEKGNPYRWVGAVTDITERKRAEETLRVSENKYRTLIENLPQKIFLKDKNSVYISCNENFAQYLKIKPSGIQGRTDYELFPKELAEKYRADDKRIMEAGKTEELEEKYIQNGREFWVNTVKTPVTDEKGNLIGILGIFWDITERKKAEQEMAALQEQLRQSQKMEAIGQLAGGVAHDFNNLLTVIKGYTQLSLLELKEVDPLKGNLEEVRKASERAAELTRQLLAFSRRHILEMRVLDLNTVLKNLDKMLHRVIGEDIELVNLLAEDLGRVKTDPGQIEQVIMNLVVNAKDAMPEGGKLVIETANVELDEEYARSHVAVTPGRYVMLSVSDTGVGMTPEIKGRVFEPFFTTKERGEGTGLGLSTVYGIVKQSGGNIWVYSEPGKGTTFKIYLPRVDEHLEEVVERVVEGKLPRGDETILVVEDDEVVRKLAARILSDQGYRVLEAPQGLEAFLMAEGHEGPIHLLVTDVVMPKMSGRELADRIASIRPEIKVLYMSGYTDNAIVHHGVLDKGMNFIQKPFTVEELARKVREVLDK